MSAFNLEFDGPSIQLRLNGELTIEHARELHAALAPVLHRDRVLLVDPSTAVRFDAAALQVLVAAAAAVGRAGLLGPSPALDDAFRRYGLTNPFSLPTP